MGTASKISKKQGATGFEKIALSFRGAWNVIKAGIKTVGGDIASHATPGRIGAIAGAGVGYSNADDNNKFTGTLMGAASGVGASRLLRGPLKSAIKSSQKAFGVKSAVGPKTVASPIAGTTNSSVTQ